MGRAIARGLATCGANVIGIGTRIEQERDDIDKEIALFGRTFHPVNCDLSDRAQIAVLLQRLDAGFFLTGDPGQRTIARGYGKVVNVVSVLSYQGGIHRPFASCPPKATSTSGKNRAPSKQPRSSDGI
ncbi:MAG: hypothetical protein JJ902_12735 [Roseibium sp.]|nr:hypothetical protein [Roseibium sp.]